MSAIHAVLGIAVLAANAAAGGWGAVSWLKGRPSVWFWYLLRVAQVTVAIQVVIGLLLLARGDRSPDGLHVAYGVSPLLVSLISEGMRFGAAQREIEAVDDLEGLAREEQIALARRVTLAEMGVMTIGTLLILTLALRAQQTGG